MQLQLSTWQEVQEYLKTSSGVVVPIGSTEQHGPNGLVGTDALTAEIIGRALGEKIGCLVAPTISVGMAVHHMDFTGSMTYRPSTLISVIFDYVQSLARHGFTRVMFVNGHGGNIATTNAAFYEIYNHRQSDPGMGNQPVKCLLANWWEGPATKKLCADLYPEGHGSHATPSEVAVTWAAYPDKVRYMDMEPAIAPTGRFTDAADYRRRFPDGRIGSNPNLAKIEDGKRLIEASVADLAVTYREFLAS